MNATDSALVTSEAVIEGRMGRLIFIVGMLVSIGSPGVAHENDITTSSHVAPVFRDGELQGCTVVFDVAHNDFAYQQGELVHLSGSLSYYVFPGKAPSVNLKLGVRPLQTQSASFSAPAEAYLVAGTGTNKADKLVTLQAETDGFRMFGFKAGDATLNGIMTMGENGRLSFGYSMKQGGMLSLVDVDFRIKRLDLDNPKNSDVDEGAPTTWVECVVKASEAGLKRLDTK